MTAVGATERLAELLVHTDGRALPDAAMAVARQIILDGAAVASAGVWEHSPRIAAQLVRELGGNPVCSVIGFGFKSSPVNAAYVNGIAMHVLDFEAMWHPPTHATSPSLPVALALGEWLGLPGAAVIAALVLGFEVQGRIGLATAHLNPDDLRLHPPGTVGVMGAAATAARLLGLNVEQTRHAFGIAASRAGGVMANNGTMTKANHCGNAARLGLEAALLAQRGYTANPEIFEHRLGYAQAIFGGRFDLAVLTAEFGRPYRMVDPGMAFKLFPSQYGTHFGINAALDLRRAADLDPAAIEAVHIITPAMGYVDRPAPGSGLEGKFSFQYTVAAALLDGRVDIDSFTDDRRFSPDLAGLLPRIKVEQRGDIPGSFHQMHVTVRVRLSGGRWLEQTCHQPRGVWGQPVPAVELADKARHCLSRSLGAAAAETCIALVNGLATAGTEAVAELMNRLRGDAEP